MCWHKTRDLFHVLLCRTKADGINYIEHLSGGLLGMCALMYYKVITQMGGYMEMLSRTSSSRGQTRAHNAHATELNPGQQQQPSLVIHPVIIIIIISK